MKLFIKMEQIQERNESIIVKNFICISMIIFVSPIMICDLYFGFSGDECLNEYPPQIHLNLKKYLLVSGFITLFNIIYMIYMIYITTHLNDENAMIRILFNIAFSYIMGTLLLVWNIMGAIIFWAFIFPEHSCNEQVNNYLFASIIIKLVVTWCSMNSRNNERD